MAELNQKSIEFFFKKYHVTDDAKKIRLLADVTDIIYDYNMLIVKLEKESDDFRQKQIERDLAELESKIDEIFIKSK